MAVYTWPSKFRTTSVDYGLEWDVQISYYRSGRVTTFGLPGQRWMASIRIPEDVERGNSIRPALEAFLNKLEGGANRLAMPHFGRPIPNGALRGSPTIAAAVSAGSKALQLTNCNGGVKAGDLIGVLGQLVMVTDDAEPFATNMTVEVRPAIRVNLNSGTSVQWNRPTALWIPTTNKLMFPYAPGQLRPAFTVEFVEAPI